MEMQDLIKPQNLMGTYSRTDEWFMRCKMPKDQQFSRLWTMQYNQHAQFEKKNYYYMILFCIPRRYATSGPQVVV